MRAGHSELLMMWYDLTAATVAATGAGAAEASRAWTVAWLAARRPLRDVHGTGARLAATVTALHDTLAAVAPDQSAELAHARDSAIAWLRGRPAIARLAGGSVARGAAAGALAASDTLADRADDGVRPGAWRPYLLTTVLPADPPPADDPSPDGDPDPALVEFWARPPLAVYTPALRAALVGLDAPFAARVNLVAVVHAVTTDALICGYAARDAGRDYVCRRAVFAGAAEIALTALAGQPAAPVRLADERSYGDWRELTADCVKAAVLSGAHTRPEALASAALGRRVAFRALSRWSGGSV